MIIRKGSNMFLLNHIKNKLALMLIILLFIAFFAEYTPAQSSTIHILDIEGTINPITAQYIVDGITNAQNNNAECIIIQMDTPGGLDNSMRRIIKEILNSNLPIVMQGPPLPGLLLHWQPILQLWLLEQILVLRIRLLWVKTQK